jgi:hypothetical protein
MEIEIHRIISEREGGCLLVANGLKCRYIRQRADGYVKWRYCKKKHTSTVTTDDSILENAKENNHSADSVQKIDRQIYNILILCIYNILIIHFFFFFFNV